ncbi:nuclear transport factor 2 family protein [Ruegeria sp. Ofav3-42]|uniref:nuclear transport factor 2 family protein n=1 Tax=Ruegeria sp. Ofav3-42 TaxID=2917759 RepID=UPI001EF654EE|nr:nuclear transport factor 2 family protein [Ruegeria sp. Ofav3-42]MCG7520548.1 nuclear transport factor 2 family protein [Ruegeria sp. Ofav3-42]
MDTQSNVEKLRAAFAAWNDSKASDIGMWEKYTTQDLCIRSLGRGQYGLDFSCSRDGHAELKEYLEDLTGAFRMEHWTLKDTIAQDDRVVGIGVTAWTNKKTGRTVETPIVIICRFRDGLVCKYEEYYDTAAFAAAAT